MRDPIPDSQVADPRAAAVKAALVLAGVVALVVLRPRLAGIIGIFAAIILMIMLHELGHFVMAKRAGMKVTEFFLGFGPRIWSTRRGETEYGIKAIPAGGYVKIIGMSNLEDVDPADEERTYRAKPYRHRLAVAIAGSTMHFVIAAVLLFILYAAVGTPASQPVVSQIVEESPAAASDFRVGDRVVAINGEPVDDGGDIPDYVQANGEKELVFTIDRQGQRIEIPLTPRTVTVEGERIARIGIGLEPYLQTKSIPAALGSTATELPKFTWQTLKALGGIFSPSGLENYGNLVAGNEGDDNGRLLSPVGLGRVAGQAVDSGWSLVLLLLISINIFVGMFNMVPLLPLDGGHVAIATYEKVASMVTGRRVRVDFSRLMPITAAVLALLVIMGISAFYLDIVRPITP